MFQLSYLKLFIGVFFALFVLSACGGGGSGAAAAAAPAEPVVQTCAEQGLYDDNGTCVAYTETTCLADSSKYWDSSNCVAKLTSAGCNNDGYNGVDAATNECVAYTQATCQADSSKYWNNSSCVAVVDASSCTANQLVVNNQCTTYTSGTCGNDGKYWNTTNSTCDAVTELSTCSPNQFVEANVCTPYMSDTCQAAGKYWDTSSNNCDAVTELSSCGGNELVVNNQCVAAIDPSNCTSNQLVVNNECTAYTAETCDTAGKYWDSSNCVAKLTVSDCDGYNGLNESTNTCIAYTQETCEADNKYWGGSCVAAVDPSTCDTNQSVVANACSLNDEIFTIAEVAFDANSTEYINNPNLAQINAHTAYAAGYTGLGQTVSVYMLESSYNSNYTGLQDITAANPIQTSDNRTPDDPSDDTSVATSNPLFVEGVAAELVTINADSTATLNESLNVGSCTTGACNTDATTIRNNRNLNLLAGRRDGTKGIHGVAYDAQIKVIIDSYDADTGGAQVAAAIKAGGSADIAAMVLTGIGLFGPQWFDTNSDGVIDADDDEYLVPFIKFWDYRRATWKSVADTTVLVSNTGYYGFNSLNDSKVRNVSHSRDDIVVDLYKETYKAKWIADNTSDAATYDADTDLVAQHAAEANINANKAAYQDDVIHDDFKGKWIVATGVDVNNVLADQALTGVFDASYDSSDQNGCGGAARYCLSVPRQLTKDNDGADQLSPVQYTLAGAIAVIREAFPNLDVKQTVALTLGTADYISHNASGDTSTVNTADLALASDTSHGATDIDNDGKSDYNAVYGHGLLNLGAATSLTAADASDANIISSSASPIGAIWGDTKLTLSSHFGAQLNSVNLGVQDKYGRHFILDAPQTSYAPIAIGLDDYIGNLLGENVQSQKLGGQAQANYSNSGEQSWMNLEYISGKATTKIAFQDSYKINPLSDTGTTTILRANNIRPASTNIGMMDVDYKLGNLTLSSYVARGEYDTGYKFDELATDFDVNYKQSHLNIAIGNIREHGQFLGTNTSGAYALNAPSVSRFTDVTYGHDIGTKFNLYANYIKYETDVDMLHDQFASIDGLQADQYQIGFTGKTLISKDDSLNVALITKLGVRDGALNQNTVLGYTEDGAFNNASQSYDLAVNQRHQQFEITYQGKLYQNADKISALRDNRFFTSIRVDSNLNHVEGASQVEVVSGINIRY